MGLKHLFIVQHQSMRILFSLNRARRDSGSMLYKPGGQRQKLRQLCCFKLLSKQVWMTSKHSYRIRKDFYDFIKIDFKVSLEISIYVLSFCVFLRFSSSVEVCRKFFVFESVASCCNQHSEKQSVKNRFRSLKRRASNIRGEFQRKEHKQKWRKNK